jgi:hypothetical protein
MSIIELGESIPALTPHVSSSVGGKQRVPVNADSGGVGFQRVSSNMARQYRLRGRTTASDEQADHWLSTVCLDCSVESDLQY